MDDCREDPPDVGPTHLLNILRRRGGGGCTVAFRDELDANLEGDDGVGGEMPNGSPSEAVTVLLLPLPWPKWYVTERVFEEVESGSELRPRFVGSTLKDGIELKSGLVRMLFNFADTSWLDLVVPYVAESMYRTLSGLNDGPGGDELLGVVFPDKISVLHPTALAITSYNNIKASAKPIRITRITPNFQKLILDQSIRGALFLTSVAFFIASACSFASFCT